VFSGINLTKAKTGRQEAYGQEAYGQGAYGNETKKIVIAPKNGGNVLCQS
jgi:hypothetical protein